MEMKTEDLKYVKQEGEDILNLEKIKQELTEEDDRFMEMNKYENDQVSLEISNLIKIKEECDHSNDEQVIEWNENTQISDIASDISRPVPKFELIELKKEVNEDVTLCDGVKVEIEEHSLSETSCNGEENASFGASLTSATCKKSEDEFTKTNNDTTRDSPPYKCTDCNYITHSKYTLNRHLSKHKRNLIGKFDCDQCNFSTSRKGTLNRHLRKHSTVKPFQCSICQQCFKAEKGLTVHTKLRHDTEKKIKTFQCDKCPFSTTSKRRFTLHKRKHGDAENLTKHKCPLCDYATYYKEILKKHAFVHDGFKPYVCNYCEYSSTSSYNLRRHLKTRHNLVL